MKKTPDKKRRSTSKKLAMTAGAVVAMGPTAADAEVTYVDDSPVTLSAFDGQGSTANWDVDGANGEDFQLWARYSSLFSSYYFSSNNFYYRGNRYGIVNFASQAYGGGGQLNGRGLVGPGGIKASALFDSFVVGPTLAGGYQWGVDDVLYRSAARFDTNYYQNQSMSTNFSASGPGIDFVNFADGSPSLLGFRFDSAGALHYGWAEVTINGADLTISRWAYESVPDTAIHVGTIPEPSSLGLLGIGAAGVLALRRRRQNAETNAELEDS